MPVAELNQLVDALGEASEALQQAESNLEGARGELETAQSVVIEKQNAVDTKVGTRNEARSGYNTAIDTLIAKLQSLKIAE